MMTISNNRDCITDTLKAIYKYQKHEKEDACHASCVQGLYRTEKKSRKNTIPFVLYTKDGCPFQADGFTTFHCKCCDEEKFKCVSTFIFRLKKIDHDCALLELLTFKKEKHCTNTDHVKPTPCNQIDYQKVKNIIRTDIYIKVKSSCFCSISCLPAQDIPHRYAKKSD